MRQKNIKFLNYKKERELSERVLNFQHLSVLYAKNPIFAANF